MKPDELRALADALRPMAKAPCFDGIDIERAADYLRAQADAQPVAWIAHNLTTGHVKWTTDRCRAHGWIQGGNLRVKSLYTHPAPAAPQAEPMADSDADYWLRNRQPILDAIERAGFMLMSNASGFWLHPRGKTDTQAEPKREPVGTLTIRDDMGAEITFHRSFTMRPRQTFAIYPNWDLLTHDIPTRGAFVVNAPKEIGNEFLPFHPAPAAPDGWKLVPVEPTQAMNNAGLSAVNQHGKRLVWETYKAMLAAAPAAPQAEPKREPLSDEQIEAGDYVLATKWSDGDPGDPWAVGFYDNIDFQLGRHYVKGSDGRHIYPSGFRRVRKITPEVGAWLLSIAKQLEASPPGTVNLWKMLAARAFPAKE